MPKIALEAAALIGVVAAIIAGSFYALGTVAYFTHLDALGFDAHQFPSAGLELQLTGFWSFVAIPAVFFVVLAAAGVIGGMKLADTWLQKLEQEISQRPIKRWLVGGAMVIAATAVITTTAGWLYALGGINLWMVALIAVLVPWSVLVPRLLVPVCAAALILIVSVLMVNQVGANSRKRAADRMQKIKSASTIIEFTDGRKITAPGVQVVCSERFCGFHDGKTATVISLEGVRSIQSPVPQEQPSPPTIERRGFWRRLFGG